MKQLAKTASEAVYTGQTSHKVNPDSIEAMKPEDDKMVTGIFKNLEQPGHGGYVASRIIKGPIFSKHFFDGEIATIPLSVARQINTRTSYQKHAHELDEKGLSIKTPGKAIQRYQFSSREFF